MFWFMIIALIVLVVLFKLGVFRKQAECRCCGKTLKGTEQTVLGQFDSKFVLCGECAKKIHPQIVKSAKDRWTYDHYTDYLAWDEETREEREEFKPTCTYGYSSTLMVDSEHGLFTIGSGKKPGIIFRFADLCDYQIDFKAEEVKEGVFGDKVKGNEFAMVEMSRPYVFLEEILNYGVSYKLRKKGFISSKYEYELSESFLEVIREFTICLYIEANKQNYYGGDVEQKQSIGEIEKALALFMFDSMYEVTEDNLKKQRNALIKSFHPDNNQQNEIYSQKINAAYEVLLGLIKK